MKLSKRIDFTCLKPFKTREDMKKFFEEAEEYNPYAVCINPYWLPLSNIMLMKTDIKICTVIGFPFGFTNALENEASKASIEDIDEIDMVMNIGAFLSGDYGYVESEIYKARNSMPKWCTLKVIIETSYLSDTQKEKAVILCAKGHADFVKTSTGYSDKGATIEDIKLLKKVIFDNGFNLKIKASGGIKTKTFAEDLISAGADRIGTSEKL